jgi:hypothetical protein
VTTPGSTRWHDEVDRHCAWFFEPHAYASAEIAPSSEFQISVCPHPATAQRPYVTLRTAGVSDYPMHVPRGHKRERRCELLTYLPAGWDLREQDWPVALLRLLGQFVHEDETWFEPGHTVLVADPGETYAEHTLISAVLLRAPTAEDPRFDTLVIDDTPCRFLWAFAITEAECDLKLEHGSDALLALIAEHDLSHVIDPGRRCLVTGRPPI